VSLTAGFTSLVGGDISAQSLRLATERDIYQDLVLAYLHALPMPFPDASFGASSCVGVITHVDDVAATLREFCRLVHPGGHVVFTCRDDLFAERAFPAHLRELSTWRALYQSPPSPYFPGNGDFAEAIQVIYIACEILPHQQDRSTKAINIDVNVYIYLSVNRTT
jgi:SAM-dependent methyltransferase